MVVYAIPIPTTKTNKTDTMHYATIGHTEDWMEDALFEIGIGRMYAAENLGHAMIGNLAGTMSPLIPGAMVKSTMTFNRISYESMHSALLAFLRWCRDSGGHEQLQEVITHLVSCSRPGIVIVISICVTWTVRPLLLHAELSTHYSREACLTWTVRPLLLHAESSTHCSREAHHGPRNNLVLNM